MKPSNILLDGTVERALLTDFGLARAVDDASITRTGIIAGTPQYMSPEQANGEAVDHRSDLFSLGSVMYAMCTGRPPFRAETTLAVLRRVGDTVPRSIREISGDIPEWLERIVARLMAKDVADRFTTASEVATLLEQCLAHVQQPTSVPLPEACRRISRGKFHRKVFWSVAAGLFALVAIGIVVNRLNVKPSPTMPTNESVKTATESPGFDSLLQWNSTQEGLNAAENEINGLEAVMESDLEETK